MTADLTQHPQEAPGLIERLVEAIYSEPRSGRPMPARIELGPDLFPEFQRAHRQALAAVLPDVADVYPGSLVGVLVVEMATSGAALVRLDGRRGTLVL
ncbi:MAG: hypothetical protein EON54_02900 [Alcaligenaceae bacterium]|nr:MAG: hypothetical protein EON54_02900 [Alcaligenaceae bacterium]